MRPKVQQYAQLLLEWNRSINLTGARSLEEVEALIDDAGVLLEASWGGITRVIDIGSGGGLPAIPLAVEMPLLIVLTLVVSDISYRLVERPFLSRRLSRGARGMPAPQAQPALEA